VSTATGSAAAGTGVDGAGGVIAGAGEVIGAGAAGGAVAGAEGMTPGVTAGVVGTGSFAMSDAGMTATIKLAPVVRATDRRDLRARVDKVGMVGQCTD